MLQASLIRERVNTEEIDVQGEYFFRSEILAFHNNEEEKTNVFIARACKIPGGTIKCPNDGTTDKYRYSTKQSSSMKATLRETVRQSMDVEAFSASALLDASSASEALGRGGTERPEAGGLPGLPLPLPPPKPEEPKPPKTKAKNKPKENPLVFGAPSQSEALSIIIPRFVRCF